MQKGRCVPECELRMYVELGELDMVGPQYTITHSARSSRAIVSTVALKYAKTYHLQASKIIVYYSS